jgi:hypothetical protein
MTSFSYPLSFQVQIIKDPKNKLYKAIVDEGTNGIYFYPSSSSKTPMAFDKKRHVIVYGDTPQASCTVGNIKSADVKAHEQENSPANSSSSNSDNFSDDDSFKVGDDIQNLKARKVKVAQAKKQSASTRVNISRKMTDVSMKGNQFSDSNNGGGEVDDDDEGSASPSPQLSQNKGGKNNRENTRGAGTVRFCNIPDHAASSNEADWRTMGAIDY